MGFFDKLKEPVFYKDDSDAEAQIAKLEELKAGMSGDALDQINQEICRVKAGITGEKQVHYELENSHIPMYVLHDLHLEYAGLTAQIDYLLITHKHQYVIECKNLYGDIEINSSGDFIRTFTYGRFTKKEGIYSPITQNRRHMELIKEMRSAEKSFLVKSYFEKNFFENYRSVVVLANPKTVLNAKFAKKEVKNQVIRVDQLTEYIRRIDSETSDSISEKEMENLAAYFLAAHKQQTVDYSARFASQSEEEASTSITGNQKQEEFAPLCPICGAPMVKRVATKGARAGKPFYGCSKYPACRGIVNLQ